MIKEEIQKIHDLVSQLDPKVVRVINYEIMHTHSCEQSSQVMCLQHNFKGCKECYSKHIREHHNTIQVKSFLEKTSTTTLVKALTLHRKPNLCQCPICNILVHRDNIEDHLGSKHSITTYVLVTESEWKRINSAPREIEDTPKEGAKRYSSKGKVKCPCDDKFRAQSHMWAHMMKHHKGQTIEEVLKEYSKTDSPQGCSTRERRKEKLKIDPLDLLNEDEIQTLLRNITEKKG